MALAFAGAASAAWAGPLDDGFRDRGFVKGGYGNVLGSTGDAVAVDEERRVVVAGSADGQVGVARRRANGSPDDSFGAHGSRVYTVGSADSWLRRVVDVEVQASGEQNIVVAFDFGGPAGEADIGLLRLTPDGVPDPSFGGDGIVGLDLGTAASVADIAVDPTGRIWMAGDAGTDAERDAFAMRLAPDGSPDATYGTGGIATLARHGEQRVTDSVLVRGRDVVLAGRDGGRPAVARLDESGAMEWMTRKIAGRPGSVQLAVPGKDFVLVATGGRRGLTVSALDESGRWQEEFGDDGLARVRMPGATRVAGVDVGRTSVVVGGSVRVGGERRPAAVALGFDGEPVRRFGSPALSEGVIEVTDMKLDRRRRVVLSGSIGIPADTIAYALTRSKPVP